MMTSSMRMTISDRGVREYEGVSFCEIESHGSLSPSSVAVLSNVNS